MSDPVLTLTGNGTLGPVYPGWNFKVDASPEAPGDSSGSTGGISFTARHGIDSEYVVDNYLDFTSAPYGSLVQGRVTGVVSNGEHDSTMTSVDMTVDSVLGPLAGTDHTVGGTGEFTMISRTTGSDVDNTGRTIVGSVVDSSGNVHVLLTGTSGDMVQVYDKYGRFFTSWGAYGVGASGIYNPTAIAIDNVGKFYIGNGAFRVSVFSSAYAYVTNFGASGTGNGQFQAVTAINAYSSTEIYVTDAVQNRVQKFNGSYTYVTKWGSTGTGNSQFLSIAGVVATSTTVWIADTTGNAIKIYSPTGTWSSTIAVSGPKSLSISSVSGGYVYAVLATGFAKFDFATTARVDAISAPVALNSIPVNLTGLYMVEQALVDPAPGDFALFNSVRFARYFGPVEPLLSDVVYYYILCGLGQEIPVFFGGSFTWAFTWSTLYNPTVSFVGWRGEIWNYIKQIMSAHGIEIVISGRHVVVRDIGTTSLSLDKAEAGSVSITLENSGTGRSVDFKNYNTSRSSGEGIMFDGGSTVYSVDVGQTDFITVRTDSSPTVVSNPVPTDLTTNQAGTYYVTDSTGTHITAAAWTAAGGSVVASIPGTLNAIDLEINGPLTAPDGLTGPYYFALYSSGERISRFSIKGTGIISAPTSLNILSGADPDKITQEIAFGVDNIAHTNKAMIYKRCSWALANASGPTLKLTATLPTSVIAAASLFGMVTHREIQFRVAEVSFGEAWSRITAVRSLSVEDFDALWNGSTVGTFDTQWDGKDFSDLKVKTLRKT